MTRPNVLCISIDSVRADYTSLFEGNDYDTTPVLDSLSADSTVFSRAISPSIWTLPVHTSVFTGLYPPEHGLQSGGNALGNHPTFAELLAEDGYETSAFYLNSWFDTSGLLRGFGISRDDPGGSNKQQIADVVGSVSPATKRLLERGYKIQKRYREWGLSGPEDRADRGDRRTVDRATDAIESADSPFCFFVHLNDAHYQYDPPNPHHRSFTDRSALGLLYNYEWWQTRVYDSLKSQLVTAVGDVQPPEREVETFKNLYRGSIEYCDSLVGTLVESLKRAGEWANTILVVFGDHGDGFGEDGVFGHQLSLHDSLLRVPLLVRDPTGRLDAGTVTSPASLVDIYPTLLNTVGIDAPETKAVDLATERREYAYTYYDASDRDWYTDPPVGVDRDQLPPARQHAIWQSESDKVIFYPDRDKHVITGSSGADLLDRLRTHTADLDRIDTTIEAVDDDVSERLKDMGYLE